MSKKILLVGGGGHCKSVLDSLIELNQFSEIGIIDIRENIGKAVIGIPVIGCDEDLRMLFNEGYKYAFVTVGSIGSPNLRIKLFNDLEGIGFQLPNIVDPSAVVSCHTVMETGIFIGKNAVVNADATICKGAIINTGSIIEHDCVVGEFVHIAPGSVLSGDVKIGKNTHIGAGCMVRQRLRIGSDSVIGMGSVVTEDIGNNIVAYGSPCKEVRTT